MTDSGTYQSWLTVFLLFGVTLLLFCYFLKRRTFDFTEEAKYKMMESYD